MAKIKLDEIIDAFIFHKSLMKAEEVKDYLFRQNGNGIRHYKDRRSFDNVIQKTIEVNCLDRRGNKGSDVFEVVDRAYYKLSNHEYYANKRIRNPDDIIIKLAAGNAAEDLELTDRTLREVNIINRNKNLVVGLKTLYDNQCQLCGTKLLLNNGKTYSEVHHIKPLGQPHNGLDTVSNMMVVCPNCHVQLDFKAMKLSKDKLTFKSPHDIDDKNIDYANS